MVTTSMTMMIMIILLFVLVLFSCFMESVIGEDRWVTVFTTPKDLETKVLGSKDVWLLGTTMLDDQSVSEEYLILLGNVYSKVKQYNIRVGYFDCLIKANTKLCQTIHPALSNQKMSLALFTDVPQGNPYTKKMYRQPIVLEGKPKDVRQVEKFLIKSFHPSNFKLIEKSTITTVDDDINGITKPTLIVIAPAEKTTTTFKNMVYKTVAQNFSSTIDVIAYKSKNPISSKLLEISQLNATYIYLVQPTKDVILFDGDVTNQVEISKWVSSITGTNSQNESIDPDDIEDNQVIGSSLIYTYHNLTDSSIGLDEEWIVAVLKNSSDSSLIGWKKVESHCGGVVKAVKLYCKKIDSNQDKDSEEEDDDDDKKEEISTIGEKLCSYSTSSDYVALVPYGVSSRKKFLSNDMSKSITIPSSNASLIIKNIGSSLPESELETISEQLFEEVLKRTVMQQKIPAFYIPEKGATSIPPSVIHVAMSMTKYVELVVISNPSKAFLSQLGMTPPVILCMLPGSNNLKEGEFGVQPVIYDPKIFGTMTYPRLTLFFRRNYLSSAFSKTEAADDLFKEAMSERSQPKVPIYEVKDNNTWFDACPSSYRGICVLHLTSKSSGYSENILRAIASEHNREGSLASTVKLMHVDGECKLSFTEQFGISTSSLPTLVIYAPFKERYTIFKGGLTDTAAVDFTISVLGGKISTIPISSRPIMNDKCDMEEIVNTEPVVEEDASDFLAEIIAEEKAKAEAVKKAAADELKRLADEKNKPKKTDKKKKKKKTKAKKEEVEEL